MRHTALGNVEGEELRNDLLLVVVRLEGRMVPVLHLGLAKGTPDRHMGAAAKANGIRGLEGIHEVALAVLRRSRLAEREAEGGYIGRLAEEGDSSPGVEGDR